MNDAIYARLENLFALCGLDTQSKYTKAEIEAYCTVLSLVKDYIDEMMKYIFIDEETESKYLQQYQKLVDNDEAEYSDIVFLLSPNFGILCKGDFIDLLQKTIYGNTTYSASYEINNGTITFEGIKTSRINKVNIFVNRWLPIGCNVEYKGNIICWDDWDAVSTENNFVWKDYDNWCATFDLIEHFG